MENLVNLYQQGDLQTKKRLSVRYFPKKLNLTEKVFKHLK